MHNIIKHLYEAHCTLFISTFTLFVGESNDNIFRITSFIKQVSSFLMSLFVKDKISNYFNSDKKLNKSNRIANVFAFHPKTILY